MQAWQILQNKVIKFHESELVICDIEHVCKGYNKTTTQFYVECNEDEWLHSFTFKTNIINVDKIEAYILKDSVEYNLSFVKCDSGYRICQNDSELFYKNNGVRIAFRYLSVEIPKFELSILKFTLHPQLQALNFIKFNLCYHDKYYLVHNGMMYEIADYNANKLIRNTYSEIKKECSHYVDCEYRETFLISPKSGV